MCFVSLSLLFFTTWFCLWTSVEQILSPDTAAGDGFCCYNLASPKQADPDYGPDLDYNLRTDTPGGRIRGDMYR